MIDSDIHKAVYFWYEDKKLNVVPFDTVKRRPVLAEYAIFQNKRITPLELNDWLKRGLFKKGMAVVPGKIYSENQEGLFWVSIDLDSQIAIDEFCGIFGKDMTLKRLGESFLVEQHAGNLMRAHISLISPIPFPKKGSDKKLGLEVKSRGEHGIMIVAPSPHRDGSNYEIIGTKTPITLSMSEAKKMIEDLNNICNKYGLNYSERNNNPRLDNKDIRWMIRNHQIKSDTTFKIEEGERNNTLFSIARSIINCHGSNNKQNLGDLKKFFEAINLKFSYPAPLTQQETDNIWKSSLNYRQENLANQNNSEQSGRPNVYDEDYEKIEYATQRLLKKYRFITIEENKQIYYYDKGVYKKGGEIIIEKEVEEDLDYLVGNRHLTEIKGHIMRKTYHKKLDLDADLDIINLKNGLYSINNNKLNPHTHKYLSINQIPIRYDAKIKPKIFGRFLHDILYKEEIRTAVEAMAYTFLRDCPYEYFFKLFGYGSNGKSVFTGLLTSLHGRDNVSNVSIKSLLDNRFALSDLESKAVNIDNELTAVSIKDTSTLKKLTGGRKQPIRIERKNQHAYDTYLYSKLFFNANSLDDLIDKTNADYRREVIISFPYTFEGKSDDPQLLQKLTAAEEMSGIFNALMIALRRILSNNGLFMNEKTIDQRRERSERVADPVKSFLEEAVEEDSIESDFVTKIALHDAYFRFCRKYKIASKSIELFGKDIKKKRFEDKRKTINGDRKNVWMGIKLKHEFLVSREQMELPFSEVNRLSRLS